MIYKPNLLTIKDPLWRKTVNLSLVLFFVFFADAILSTSVPGLVETFFKSPIVMGFVLSFSSIVGLGVDLIFPQIIRGIRFNKLLFFGILCSLVFSLSLIWATLTPFILVFLVAMAIWGIYYEVIGFANHQFVADTIPYRLHASTWAFMGVFKNLAYFLGPLFAGFLISTGPRVPAYFAIIFALVSLLILYLTKKQHERPLTIEVEKISFVCEIEHWGILFKSIWPIFIMSVVLGIIDAVFWTTGAVYTEVLTKTSFWGRWFLPMYALPSLFVGFIVAKKGIVSGKKKSAMLFFLLSGIFLAMITVYDSILWELLAVFCSSLALAVTYPLIEGVYSDVIERMGTQRKHMIGLCSSTTSISYIVGPILAGFVSSQVGSKMTFTYLGYAVIIVAFFLMITTPKKIKLPQTQIKKWKD
ncbi:MAG: Major facilitator superfamily [Candidatus Woesebacteria bacterium GW2011_GWA1_39_21]|uniref:Major facilitator superfamily n=1 Tax=Candidatus Woesebacteria bacterium GW2011_GWA1_39_21 TaxID=1618550 RepID=A0A0G0QHI4_9BACT|nr:MAG: Major facilitator superfamily [Candidatus Woesebacteria bacterium GW2011_GWA1_39_21]